jgi:Zn-dependent protease with chaperone function
MLAIALFLGSILPVNALAQRPPKQTVKLTNQPKTPRLDPTNTQTLIDRFGALQSPDFAKWLASNLPSPASTKTRDDGFSRAAWQSQIHIVQDQKTCDRLQQQAAPALKLFNRQEVRFVVYFDNYPQMQTISGHIAVSTGLLRLLKTDAQLNGLTAHELARDLYKDRFISAWKNGDFRTIRQFELFYDAVAVSTLQYLGMPSEDYALILRRMMARTTSQEDFSMNSDETKRHPPLPERLQLIRNISLKQSPITRIMIASL